MATQFFAAMIVLDNLQPKAAEGGVDRKSILAWGRPTLETTERRGRIRSIIENDTLVFAEADNKVTRLRLLPHVSATSRKRS